MNKQAITKYLAEKMGWNYWDCTYDYRGEFPMFFWDEESGMYWVYPIKENVDSEFAFDPFNDIRHAFMVAEHIGLFHEAVLRHWIGDEWQIGNHSWDDLVGTDFLIDATGDTPAEAITLAAFKALAPAELQKELL